MDNDIITDLVLLSKGIDIAQAYLMHLARSEGEITLTFKEEYPQVTVFLGSGPNANIGFGTSVALAIINAQIQPRKDPNRRKNNPYNEETDPKKE